MKYMLLIYNDPELLQSAGSGETDAMMRNCLAHADELRQDGRLLESQMLDVPQRARTVRIRGGKTTFTDGPFSETKELLGGFNLIEAENIEEAMRIAAEFPWARTGSVEVRPVVDIGEVRRQVGAAPGPLDAQ